MSNCRSLFIFSTLPLLTMAGAGCGLSGPPPADDIQETRGATIYGADNRTDWYQISDPDVLARIDASVALFQSPSLAPNPDGLTTHITLTGTLASFVANLCTNEPFYNQPCADARLWCSASLVGPDLVLTAYHCTQPLVGVTPDLRAVFGFRATDATHAVVDVPNGDVYGVSTVASDATQDWQLLRLSRPVPPSRRPMPVRRTGTGPIGLPLAVVGYPGGLPVKYAGAAMAFDQGTLPSFYMMFDVDALAGNSGSPIINAINGQIEAIEKGGGGDYYNDPNRGCVRTVVWPSNNQVFERGVRLPLFASFIDRDSTVAVGINHSCAVLRDGRVACWGSNAYGQLGDGTTTNRSVPTIVPGLRDAVEVAVGANHTCARMADRTLRCWGYNAYGELGNGSTLGSSSPVVANVTDVTQVGVGSFHTCVRLADRTVRCFGFNSNGQLGDGTLNDSLAPIVVSGVSGVLDLASNNFSNCVVLADGTGRCWGWGVNGQLGNGSTSSSNQPLPGPVQGLTNAQRITAGTSHYCSMLRDHTARCWGNNVVGQLGDGTYTTRATAAAVNLSDIHDLKAGVDNTCARNVAGNLWCWGSNTFGQVGDGSTGTRPSPVAVPGITDVADFGVGRNTVVRFEDGRFSGWGYNGTGNVGDGTTTTRTSPVHLPSLVGALDVTVSIVGSCTLLADGSARCTGWSLDGEVGDGTTYTHLVPTQVINLSPILQIANGGLTTCAVFREGDVTCWGNNDAMQLGDPQFTAIKRTAPDPASVALTLAAQVASGVNSVCARRTDGTVWCWGNGANGQLGDNTNVTRAAAAPVSGLSSVTGLSLGWNYGCALLSSGALRCWGTNNSGQLGTNDAVERWTPAAVGGVTTAKNVSAGEYHACAALADGSARCWGYNPYGELGDGTTTTRYAPVTVPGLSSVTQVASGRYHTCALRSDGTVACWGQNTQGQLGDGTTTNRLAPTTVPGLGGVKKISAYGWGTCALLYDGTTRCWGQNGGQVGDNTTTMRTSPTSPAW